MKKGSPCQIDGKENKLLISRTKGEENARDMGRAIVDRPWEWLLSSQAYEGEWLGLRIHRQPLDHIQSLPDSLVMEP